MYTPVVDHELVHARQAELGARRHELAQREAWAQIRTIERLERALDDARHRFGVALGRFSQAN